MAIRPDGEETRGPNLATKMCAMFFYKQCVLSLQTDVNRAEKFIFCLSCLMVNLRKRVIQVVVVVVAVETAVFIVKHPHIHVIERYTSKTLPPIFLAGNCSVLTITKSLHVMRYQENQNEEKCEGKRLQFSP